ncbi:lambda exonuclease family protein [Paraburkholderia phenoliruptrix]|uniref:lambda exonuclease family protein n=1 Tax=Paraburkholderia phenoliruptrix TaxID=252970 RepID=UPI00285D2F88|nr:YqaJ viral recombinase family protein [Paraburkholderia phenoliruptrix]MDR6389165.1 exodeoxyribonuclease (lambda-induced) [Paraburkholderia phenoliruptrix]
MLLIEAVQGSQEWLQARSGAITASRVSDAISVLQRKSGSRNPGDPTDASDKYAYEVAFERISGVPYAAPIKAYTLERGHALEPVARMLYEERTGNLAMESGIVLSDDRKFGYSSDGFLNDDHGIIEIKCPVDTVKIMHMLMTGDTSEYDHQIQFGLFLTGRAYCDFIQYVPALESVGRDLYIKRIERNEEFIDDMVAKLLQFEKRVTAYEQMLRQQAA